MLQNLVKRHRILRVVHGSGPGGRRQARSFVGSAATRGWWLVKPGERFGDGFFPEAVAVLAECFGHAGCPGAVDGPVGAEFAGILEETDGEAGGVGGAEG